MPSIGERKTVTHKFSKSDINSEIDFLESKITRTLTKAGLAYIATVTGAKVTEKLAGVVASSLVISNSITDYLYDNRLSTMKDYLKDLKEDSADGVKLEVPMIYMYQSGSGTGWYKAGNPEVSTY